MFACPTSFQLIKQAGNFHLYPLPYITHTQHMQQGGGAGNAWLATHQLREPLQQQQEGNNSNETNNIKHSIRYENTKFQV